MKKTATIICTVDATKVAYVMAVLTKVKGISALSYSAKTSERPDINDEVTKEPKRVAQITTRYTPTKLYQASPRDQSKPGPGVTVQTVIAVEYRIGDIIKLGQAGRLVKHSGFSSKSAESVLWDLQQAGYLKRLNFGTSPAEWRVISELPMASVRPGLKRARQSRRNKLKL